MEKNSKNNIIKLAYPRLMNWKHFFLGYLNAARKCAESYLNYESGNKLNKFGEFAFIPAFWNFKHAIELVLKFIEINKERRSPYAIINVKILERHNLNSLISRLNGKLDKEQVKQLSNICNKYITLKPLEVFIDKNKQKFCDPENKFFKYPEDGKSDKNKAHVGFEHCLYDDLFLRFGRSEKMKNVMTELKKDSGILSRLCGKIFNS